MDIPENLNFTKDHEWVSSTSGAAKIGISAFAIEQLGDIVHIELPEVGDSFEKGDSFGSVESTKTVSDLYMPLGGKVVEINDSVVEEPESIQQDSYKNGWLLKIEISSNDGADDLMKAAQYEKFIKDSD